MQKFITRARRENQRMNKFVFLFSSTGKSPRFILPRLIFFILIFIFPALVYAQRISILTPEKTATAADFASRLGENLAEDFKVLDNSLSETAFNSVAVERPYNLTATEAKNIGKVIGCHYFLLVKSDIQRRVSLKEGDNFEAFAAVFTVSSRTGRLIFWRIESQFGATAEKAQEKLNDAVDDLSHQIFVNIKRAEIIEKEESHAVEIEEIPAEDAPGAKNFRPPLPFRRVKPKYTQTAYLYDVAATVDVLVDISETGEILRTEIVRWAGFGLDESVVETIRQMNWRAAERDKKFIPMRVLLRYNFKKIEPAEN